jgi:7,8-dihydropterin-6-yl-methyl-4-(beta-D-ribofuranosyl)aminobenzene 5'-phosphate synthase
MTALQKAKLREVDTAEVVSLVDNTVDYLSGVSHKQAQQFGQWTRERYGKEWSIAHTEFPYAEHGFSVLVRTFVDGERHSILFDTGSSPEMVVENASRMGIKLTEVEAIVMSHGHYDHSGGLLAAIKAVNKADLPIIVHEGMFLPRGTEYADGTIRKFSDFPTKPQMTPACAVSTKQPSLIAEGTVCVTGEIPRQTNFEKGPARHRAYINGSWQPDPVIRDDRALAVNVKRKGLVVVSGCAHAGIVNTVRYAQQITDGTNVYAVLGGFHLSGRENEARIEPTTNALKQLNLNLIAPSHCTGWKAMIAISEAMPDAFVWNSVGNLYKL